MASYSRKRLSVTQQDLDPAGAELAWPTGGGVTWPGRVGGGGGVRLAKGGLSESSWMPFQQGRAGVGAALRGRPVADAAKAEL